MIVNDDSQWWWWCRRMLQNTQARCISPIISQWQAILHEFTITSCISIIINIPKHPQQFIILKRRLSKCTNKIIIIDYSWCGWWLISSVPNDSRTQKYLGFRIQFPSAYDQEFYVTSEEDRQAWMKAIQDVSGVRRIEDYYEIREKIGEGRFAEVYRVSQWWWCSMMLFNDDNAQW